MTQIMYEVKKKLHFLQIVIIFDIQFDFYNGEIDGGFMYRYKLLFLLKTTFYDSLHLTQVSFSNVLHGISCLLELTAYDITVDNPAVPTTWVDKARWGVLPVRRDALEG